MKRFLRIFALIPVIAIALVGDTLAQTVSSVTARQRYPWNNLVDIDYTIQEASDTSSLSVRIKATDQSTGRSYDVTSLDKPAPMSNGCHRVTWNPADDGVPEGTADFIYTVSLYKETSQSVDFLYMVIDLSAGPNADSYPVSYLYDVPVGGWTDEYKTTKLVLRRIPKGTFMMGSPENELGRFADETQHKVTLTRDFYMGVFEVTQKQWEQVTGAKPSHYRGAVQPVEQVSYDDIRGLSAGAGWPGSAKVDAGSFLGKLRAKTGVDAFDLPTEAQWEYACRAGTTTALNSGKNLSDIVECSEMDEAGRYKHNCGKEGYGVHTAVGSYKPNAWGLYDMHGNVAEWCLDWYCRDLEANAVTDPAGAESGSRRVLCGGASNYDAQYCRSASRNGGDPARDNATTIGFRLSWFSDRPLSETVLSSSSSPASSLDICHGDRTVGLGTALRLTYSDRWDGASGGKVSMSANEQALFSGKTGEGVFEWTPPHLGSFDLAHSDGDTRITTHILVNGSCTLSVSSEAAVVGLSVGTHSYSGATPVTATASSSVAVSDGERKECIGWTGTGSVPASGTGTSVSFTLDRDSSLSWKWRTEYRLSLACEGGGTVDVPAESWHASGAQVTVTATPSSDRRFAGWEGDLDGCSRQDNVLAVPMDRPRSVRAKFKALVPPATKTTPVPVPYEWLDGTHLVFDGDYEKAARAVGMNGRPVWESYVAGLNPLNPDSRFRASVEMVDGKPVVVWSPDLGDKRVYKVFGKRNLSDPKWEPRADGHRFFKVEVAMP